MVLVAQPNCDPGRFTTLPKPEIDPKPADPMTAVDIFGSGNSGLAFEFPRVAGHADYDIDGNQFHIEWNVKEGLDNGCFSRITGPRANRFRILFSISTHGNEKFLVNLQYGKIQVHFQLRNYCDAHIVDLIQAEGSNLSNQASQ